VKLDLTAYTIGGNNFFKLRDVMSALDVGVTWDNATSTIGIDSSIGYATTPTEESVNTIDLSNLPPLPEGAQGWAKAKRDTFLEQKSIPEIVIKSGEILPYRYNIANRLYIYKDIGDGGGIRAFAAASPDDWEILS
jgi:hypothetical protein